MTAATPTMTTGGNHRDLRVIACSNNGSGIEVIRCSTAVLEEIRRRATEQFLSIPRGGLEVGGFLFGSMEGKEVSVFGSTELSIEYINGPSFSLSPQDEVNLQDALSEQRRSMVVGWWHSHTRSDTSITREDIAVHSKFFNSRAPLALIIKPHKFDSAEIGVYAADRTGVPATEPCCRFVSDDKEPAEVAPPAVVIAAAPWQTAEPPHADLELVPAHYSVVPQQDGPRSPHRTLLARLVTAIFLFLGSAAATVLLRMALER